MRNKPDKSSDGNEESSAPAELDKTETTCDNNHAVKASTVRHDDQQLTASQMSSVATGR